MRALKDNHFNNSFSLHHQDKAREVSLEAQVVSLDLDRASREEVLEVSQVVALAASRVVVPVVFQVVAPAASLEVPEVAQVVVLEEALAAILQCQWDRPLLLLRKCNNYPLASHSKVPVV